MRQPNLLAPLLQPRPMTEAEVLQLNQDFSDCAGYVKMMVGVSGNAALTIMQDAYDRIADVRSRESYAEEPWHPHPRFRHTPKQLLKAALKERDRYLSHLLLPPEGELRFFHVADMPDKARRRYGETTTDREYFEFWQATGSGVYSQTRPLVTSLWNKYRLSLQQNGSPAPDQVAWGITAMTALQLAVVVWEASVLSSLEVLGTRLSEEFVRLQFRPLSLERVAEAWRRALVALAPETEQHDLDDSTRRNIEMGVEQLREAWMSADLPYTATMKAVEDYDEDVFRTRGEAKKALRELGQMRSEATAETERIREEQLKEKYGIKQ